MKYSGEYLWPPRPSNSFPSAMINSYEQAGYVAQAKKNGTCTLLVLDPKGNTTAYDRHHQIQKAWKPPINLTDRIRRMLPSGHAALVCELLHSKVPGIRDTLYIFDVVAIGNEILEGTTFRERHKILSPIFKHENMTETHYDHGGGLLYARTFAKGHLSLYNSIIKNPEDEGIVVKNPDVKLSSLFREGTNDGWQAKCRRPTKNYSF